MLDNSKYIILPYCLFLNALDFLRNLSKHNSKPLEKDGVDIELFWQVTEVKMRSEIDMAIYLHVFFRDPLSNHRNTRLH